MSVVGTGRGGSAGTRFNILSKGRVPDLGLSAKWCRASCIEGQQPVMLFCLFCASSRRYITGTNGNG